jgi:hypothetical protein
MSIAPVVTEVAPSHSATEPLAMSDDERTDLQAALRFAAHEWSTRALESSTRALEWRVRAEAVAAAFEALAARIEANDRRSTERAIAPARAVLHHCRPLIRADARAMVALEALSLALEHAERLARDSSEAARANGRRG